MGTEVGEDGMRGIELLLLAVILVNFLENLGHVLDLIEQVRANKNGLLLRRGNGDAIAWAGIDLNQLGPKFVALLEHQPGVVGRILEFSDDDPFDTNIKPLENIAYTEGCYADVATAAPVIIMMYKMP